MRKRQKVRLSESFESNSECNDRLLKNTKVKKHGSAVSWNSKECLNEVQMYDSEVKFINFTGLAKKYDMKNKEGNIPGNGGQVVKEFLIENGIDLSSFNYKSKDRNNENTRRCKRKIKGTSISLPCDPTNVKVKKELKRMVHEGNYSLGELIVPQKYKKVVLNDDLSLSDVDISLESIRKFFF